MYILDFFDIGKEVIWGGDKLAYNYNKAFDKTKNIGESFEVSVIESMESVVKNGEFKGISLRELAEKYKEDILGINAIEGNAKYSVFPLLVKLIDAKDKLSIQVHPDDDYAKLHYNSLGKNEMWVVLDAEAGSKLLIGFNEGFNKEDLKHCLEKGENVENIFKFLDVQKGDTFYIPAGCVHAILGGVVIAEIQTSSDLTFRVYDWGRVDKNGRQRELNIKEALETIKEIDTKKIKVEKKFEKFIGYEKSKLVENKFFNVEEINIEESKTLEYSLDKKSFEIIMTLEGDAQIKCEENEVELYKTKTVLIPASVKSCKIDAKKYTKVLRIRV